MTARVAPDPEREGVAAPPAAHGPLTVPEPGVRVADPAQRSLIEQVIDAGYSPAQIMAAVGVTRRADLKYAWRAWARPKQIPPPGDWLVWLLQCGRGWGKTLTGAQCVRARVKAGARAIAFAGRTLPEARELMVTGPSGILEISPPAERPAYLEHKRLLVWPSGAVAHIFTGEDPEQGRGFETDTVWADEVAAWQYPQVFDNLKLGLRASGVKPMAVVTTTPKPHAMYRKLIAQPGVVRTIGGTTENEHNLAEVFLRFTVEPMRGTRAGRQELNAEVLTDAPGALWTSAMLERTRVAVAPRLVAIVVFVDPAVTYGPDANETGIVVAGLSADGHLYVLGDASGRYTVARWARMAVDVAEIHGAEAIGGEENNGGDLVQQNIRLAKPDAAYVGVKASRGKRTRAEPIAALTEMGRVHMVGVHPQLEQELTEWEPATGKDSPNRLDAAVWALSYLASRATLVGTIPALANLPRPEVFRVRGMEVE